MFKFIAAGAVIGAIIVSVNTLLLSMGFDSMILGFTVMFAVLSGIYFMLRAHRDQTLDEVISFSTAFGYAVLTALAATLAYVVLWELYLSVSDATVYDDYVAGLIAAEQEAGTSGAEFESFLADMDALKVKLADPLYRMPMTSMEIFPAGLVVSLISAALVRR